MNEITSFTVPVLIGYLIEEKNILIFFNEKIKLNTIILKSEIY